MRDLDQLVHAMRDEADQLPLVPLLPAVRSGARHLRRRRRVGALSGLTVVGALVATGATHVGSRHSADPAASATVTPTASQSFDTLVGKTWYLTSVSRNGRTWRPAGSRPSTLTFRTSSSATTDDGSNTEEWTLEAGAGRVTWTAGPSTLASETASSLQVGSAVSAVFSRSTSWALDGEQLVFRGEGGASLRYSPVAPPRHGEPTGIAVFLDVNPAGGVIARGQELHLTAGRVTVRNDKGEVVLAVSVTKDDAGNSALPPGRYTVSATIPDGSCTSKEATVVQGQVSEVDLVCRSPSSN
jgi:hypothetical protein